jgi:hypothetical protein
MERKHYLARLHVLAHMIDRGQILEWSEEHRAYDGEHVMRVVIEVDQPTFWRTFQELAPERRRSRR